MLDEVTYGVQGVVSGAGKMVNFSFSQIFRFSLLKYLGLTILNETSWDTAEDK